MTLSESEKDSIGWYKGSSIERPLKCQYLERKTPVCGFMTPDHICHYCHRCKYQYEATA